MGIKKSFEKNPSSFSLKGLTPSTREGALPTSQLHAQGETTSTIKPDHSVHDLDGLTPSKYLDNKPS